MLLAIGGGFWLTSSQLQGMPQQIHIFHGEQRVGSYPYPQPGSPPQQISVMGDIGEATITLSPDGVRMTDAPCHNKQCVLSGLHSHSGDMIICLPNRISIVVVGSSSDSQNRLDALGQ